MSKFNQKIIQEEQKSFNNNIYFSDLKIKELFKAKMHFQKNTIIRKHSSRDNLTNNYNLIHSISTNQIFNRNNNLNPSINISERKNINNLNINFRNLNFNNTFNDLSKNNENKKNENRSFSRNYKLNKIFSKIGNDFIIKNNMNFSKPKKDNKIKNLKTKLYNNNNLSNIKISKKRNKFGTENIIENLIYLTKDKPLQFNLKKNTSNSSLDSINKINIKKDYNEKESQLIDNNDLEIHFKIWESIFEMENHYDNKNLLINLSKKFLNLISIEIEKKRKFKIFQLSNLNLLYQKIIKLYIILQVYIRFLLRDFNYEVKLKSNVKNILFNINEYFILLISNFVFIKENLKENKGCSKINKECINSYNFLIKNHKIKKIKEQPFILALTIFKNLDIPISIIKQFSNNFFKIGYFTSIHSICIELFKYIDISTINEIYKIVNINILYYITNNNLKKNIQNNKNDNINNNNNITNKNNFEDINNFDLSNKIEIFNIQYPLLPPLENEKNNIYTLVLDLDETLVHFFYTPSGGTFLIRPYCFEFLNKMSKIFEIVIFTAAMKDYADSILDILDLKKNIIKYRLYRQHTSIEGMSFSKDLSKLGRDLNKVIIIDNLSDNFKLQPNNGIHIGTWIDNMKDTELLDIGNFLEDLILRKPNDVRIVIQKIKEDFEIKNNTKNVVCCFKNIDLNKFME